MNSDIQKLLFEIYNRPDDFILRDDRVIRHKPTGQEVWVYRKDYRLYKPYRIEFSFFDRRRFHRAFKWWMVDARKEQRIWLRNFLCEPTSPPIKATARAD